MLKIHWTRFVSLLAALLFFPASSPAHFIILLPDRPAVRARDPAAGEIFYGHPFEHEIMDMVEPESLQAITPGGSVLDLTSRLTPVKKSDVSGKKITTYRFQFEPKERGDHVLAFTSKPRREGEEGLLKDLVKVTLHVQGERGWDRAVGHPLEIQPLTRPYGLRPGAIFTARALVDEKPLEGELVEIERYNPKPPENLPENEYITRTLRTGPGGLIATTLDETGWWAISVSRVHGTSPHQGKELPLTLRATFWIYVGEPLKAAR